MSYHTWHIYGYGIKTSDINDLTVEKLQALIHLAPHYENTFTEWLKNCDITEPTLEDYFEYDENECYGLAGIMKEVIFECEGIDFTACDDFDGFQYLLYEQSYPWHLNDIDKTLTPEKVSGIIKKYLTYLTDKEIEIGYFDPANGG